MHTLYSHPVLTRVVIQLYDYHKTKLKVGKTFFALFAFTNKQ